MKKLHLKKLLLMAIMLVGAGGAWADDTYVKVTSTSDLVADAEYILLETSTDTKYLANTTYSSSKYGSVTTGFTISGNNVTVSTETAALVLKLGGSAGAWTLYDVSAKQWVGKAESNTNFQRSDAATVPTTNNAYYWTIKTNGSELAVYSNYKTSSKDHTGRYWGRNNSSIGPYDGSSYPACVLYKKVKQDPTITFSNGSVNVGKTLDLSSLFSSNSDGAVTYSITSGDSYASISGSTLTGVASGSVTVQASQAATSSYNAKTVTATITVNAALTLSSIAITTPPTKTTYNEGELFDAAGMVVTATYSDNSTDDVTALCTWAPNGVLTTSDEEVIISYTENSTTKTATQAITVNEYEQPTSVTINLTQTFWGQTTGHTSGQATEDLEFSGSQDNVTISYIVPKGSYYYYNTSNTRPYNTCTLKFDSPFGYVITSITFTSDGSNWKTATPTNGAMSSSNEKKWEGQASSVSFNWAETGTRIKTVVVTLSNTVNATVTTAGWATWAAPCAVSFGTTKAYIIELADNAEALLTVVTSVPAGTPVLLEGAGNKTFDVVASSDTDVEENCLKVSDGTAKDGIFVLADGKYGVGFYVWTGENALSKGKIYLEPNVVPTSRSFISLRGATTAIKNVNDNLNVNLNDNVFDLQGRRVAQPTKGLYIVNGKKVVKN